jgi:hypothetical protein
MKYQALTNLSVPRKGDPNRETDLVLTGEVIDLDDATAALFLPPARQPAVIRKASEAGSDLVPLLGRQLSGVKINPRTGQRIGMPAVPADARPDPDGSSAVQVIEPPEAREPQPGSETRAAGRDDALDIPPRRAGRVPAKAR